MIDRYASWIHGQIEDHAPSDDHDAVMRLASAAEALGGGGGMIFGMAMPAELTSRAELAELRAEAIAMLERWVPRLSAGATDQLAELARRANLPLDLSERRAVHAARRQAELDERIAKSLTVDVRYSELERAIVEDPEDPESYLVLADYLQREGDPRGELIVLQLRGETDPAAYKAAQKYLDKHREALIGPLAPHQKVHDGSNDDAFIWRRGYIDRAKVSCPDDDADESAAEIVELLLRHPVGRFLRELAIGFDGQPGDGALDGVIAAISEQLAPSLRKLHLGDFEYPDQCEISWFEVGDLGELWRALPRLQHLVVQGGTFELGDIEHERLERLEVFTGGLATTNARAIASLRCPQLRHLDVWYGGEDHGWDGSIQDIAPLLARVDLPQLRHLGLRNCELTDEICAAIVTSPLLPQLAVLDLSMGTLSDEGARMLARQRDALRHLEVLDVSKSFLSNDGRDSLRGICARVIDDDQQDDDGGARYVSVSE
ncbi:MAG: TIGR02996 domain-containing protein [Deltaproteobacteria bacterium]|nr:TIGR02996 domain-containing protein [Deltaproteobacteria bacterium]MDQ3300717.1 TIGR02996 domain-containing protein [Myxococcota bacterium]